MESREIRAGEGETGMTPTQHAAVLRLYGLCSLDEATRAWRYGSSDWPWWDCMGYNPVARMPDFPNDPGASVVLAERMARAGLLGAIHPPNGVGGWWITRGGTYYTEDQPTLGAALLAALESTYAEEPTR